MPPLAFGAHTLQEWFSRTVSLRAGERELLDAHSGGGADLVFPTRTRTDVGYWLGKRRVWGCVWPDRLMLFSYGRRPFIESIPTRELGESRYNHVTGEVLLAPAEHASCIRLKLAPLEGYDVLSRFSNKEAENA